MKKIVSLGAGGHARVIWEILELRGGYELVGLLQNQGVAPASTWGSVPVLGGDDQLPRLKDRGVEGLFVGVGSVGEATIRRVLFDKIQAHGFEVMAAIHPQAVISLSASVGIGAIIMAGALINTGARLGHNVIINTGAIIEHDCVVENDAHVAPGAVLAGNVTVGEGSHVGLGAVVRQGVKIGRRAMVGAGAVVLQDVAEGATVVGVPARERN